VVLGEAAGQRLGQLRDLDPQAAAGQLGQLGRVTLPADEGLEHRPAGHAGDVAGDRGQLDPGVLEQLPLDLLGPFPHQRGPGPGPGPGQVPELTDRLGRDERAADQSVRTELRQSCRVGDVGLAGWQVLDVLGVDQRQLERDVLEQVVERLPVVPGRFHHDQRDPFGGQVITQR
jgi:hypothetical protein